MTKSRNTRQKEILEEEIRKTESFFTSEDIFEKAKEKDKNIGIATVYRFLKTLSKKEILHSYRCDKKKIYSKENKSHCHFICERCGNTSHFNIEKLNFLKSNIEGEICHFQIDIKGICKDCKNN